MKKEKITSNTTETQSITRDYCEQLYANKNRQSRRNGQILRKVRFLKTVSGRKKYEQTNYQ